MKILLGINIDHVATVRQTRGTSYPDILEAARAAIVGGADSITVHLREDRRHIQDYDVIQLKQYLTVPLNLEIACTSAMIEFAAHIAPKYVCVVPEKREERTTEGGLDVLVQYDAIEKAVHRLTHVGTQVSLFIEPDPEQIRAAYDCGAPCIEIHTGQYADATTEDEQHLILQKIIKAAHYADSLGLIVNAGHGLTVQNVQPIAAIPMMHELNIGHSIVARALFVGLAEAVKEMKVQILHSQSIAV